MDQVVRMRRVQCVRHLTKELQRSSGLQAATRADDLLEISSFHKPHRDVQEAIRFSSLVNGDDIRVIDRCREPRLPLEPLPEFAIRLVGTSQHFESHPAMEAKVACSVDEATAAPTDSLLDPVPGELRTRLKFHLLSWWGGLSMRSRPRR